MLPPPERICSVFPFGHDTRDTSKLHRSIFTFIENGDDVTFSVFPREMGRGLLGENFKFEMNNHRERHGSKRRTNRRTVL